MGFSILERLNYYPGANRLSASDSGTELAPRAEAPVRVSRMVSWLAILTTLLHFATNLFSPYGIHRDEFLYLAMGRHLHLWRMEFPPAIAILAKVSTAVLGESRFAIRFLPAVAAGLLVYLAGRIAGQLGGSRAAQIIAAVAVVASPLFLRAGNLFQPV